MPLEKLEMTPLDQKGAKVAARRFKVMFNPTTYSISSSVTWEPQASRELNVPPLTYGGGASRTLTLELFYDVTEPIDGARIDDVREETNKVVTLARKDRDLGRPPVVAIEWGAAPLTGSDFPFIGVVSALTQNFTLFNADGTPVRADLNVTFTEFASPEIEQRKLDPEFTTRVVTRGDTLSGIAAELYGDPALWRVIARANRLDDPRQLEIGRRLQVPKIA
jgi:Contractile injection system tube protein/LysM domain